MVVVEVEEGAEVGPGAHGVEVGAQDHRQGCELLLAVTRAQNTVKGHGGRPQELELCGVWQAIRGGVDTGATLIEVRPEKI